MRTFKDNAGRTWTVALNVDAIKRAKTLAGANLLEAVSGELLEKLIDDPILLCDVVFAVVKPEADARNISDEDFGRAMGGDAIDSATSALLEELVDFSPRQRRPLLKKVLAKHDAVQDRVIQAGMAKLDSPELERQIEKALSAIGDSSSSLPAS